jgi:hypothetical protein
MVHFRLNPKGRIARDDVAEEGYPDARQHFEGGIPSLAKWCRKNLRRSDIEALIKELEGELSHRMTAVIGEDSAKVKEYRRKLEASFARVYGPGPRVLPSEPQAPMRPTNPAAMRAAGETLANILGGLAPNKVLK